MSCRVVEVEGVGYCHVQFPGEAVWTPAHDAAFAAIIRAAAALEFTPRPDAHPDALAYLAARLHMDRLLA